MCVPTSTPPAPPARHTGGQSNYTKYPDEPDDHAIGRSRGGLTTKIHALSDQSCSPVTVVLSAGQAGDNPMLWPLLEERKAASADLRLLRAMGLVTRARRGRSVIYSLYDNHVALLLDEAVYHIEHLGLGITDETSATA